MDIEDIFYGTVFLAWAGVLIGGLGYLGHRALGVIFGWLPLSDDHFRALLVISAIAFPAMVFGTAFLIGVFY